MQKKLVKFLRKLDRGEVIAIFLLLLMVGLRAYLYRGFSELEYYLKYDEAIYAMLSQKFVNGDFNLAFHPYWNAGFPLATIPFYKLTGSWESAQLLVSEVSHLALIVVMYFTLRGISRPLALLTSFFAAFSPTFSKLVTAGGVTEPLYIVLFWLAIYFGWEAVTTRKLTRFGISGFFFGLAYLTRTEIIYTLFFFLWFAFLSYFLALKKFPSINRQTLFLIAGGTFAYLYIPITKLPKFTTFQFLILKTTKGILFAMPFAIAAILTIFFKRNKTGLISGFKKLIPGFVLLGTMFLLVNLPYVIAISKQLNHATLSGKYAFVGSAHPFTPEKDRDTTWAQDIWSIDHPNYKSPYYDSSRVSAQVWKFIEHALEALPKKFNTNLNSLAYSNTFTNFEITMVIVGAILALASLKLRRFSFYLLILWFGSFVFVSHFMDVAARYVAFSFPIFYIAQAYLLITIANFLSRSRPAVFPFVIILFAIWYTNLNFDLSKLSPATRSISYPSEKLIGDYLKSEKIEVFMGRTEGLAFYGDAKIIYTPAANPETIIRIAKEWGIEYIVAKPSESSWDYMRAIARLDFKHTDVEPKHKFEDGTIIWKVKLTEEEKLHNFRTDKDVNIKYPDLNINSQTILKYP